MQLQNLPEPSGTRPRELQVPSGYSREVRLSVRPAQQSTLDVGSPARGGCQQSTECSVRRLLRAGTAREAEHWSFNQKVQRTWRESMKNNFDTLK